MGKRWILAPSAVVLLISCGSPSSPSPGEAREVLESRMRSFAGSSAINCGRLARTASDQEMQAALSCALSAAGQGLGFTLSREYQGIDSFVAEGLMARAGDPIFKFLFDGGVQSSNGSFSTQPCPQPFLAPQSGRTVFACR